MTMLPRSFRLRRREDFEAAHKQGQHWRDGMLILNVLPNGLALNRFGFVASRQIGSAAARNRLKRRLRAAVWTWLPHLARGNDVVIIARPAASDAAYQELNAALGRLFGLAGLLVPQDVEVV